MAVEELADGRIVTLVKTVASDIKAPVEVQGHLTDTKMTHNAVSNPSNSNGAWINVDGMIEVIASSTVAGTIKLEWSFDGTTVATSETSGASVSIYKAANGVVAPFVRVVLTATGTVTAYVYSKA